MQVGKDSAANEMQRVGRRFMHMRDLVPQDKREVVDPDPADFGDRRVDVARFGDEVSVAFWPLDEVAAVGKIGTFAAGDVDIRREVVVVAFHRESKLVHRFIDISPWLLI